MFILDKTGRSWWPHRLKIALIYTHLNLYLDCFPDQAIGLRWLWRLCTSLYMCSHDLHRTVICFRLLNGVNDNHVFDRRGFPNSSIIYYCVIIILSSYVPHYTPFNNFSLLMYRTITVSYTFSKMIFIFYFVLGSTWTSFSFIIIPLTCSYLRRAAGEVIINTTEMS